MSGPTIRYIVELLTDDMLRWFARIETRWATGSCSEYTATHETWDAAMKTATDTIKAKRENK